MLLFNQILLEKINVSIFTYPLEYKDRNKIRDFGCLQLIKGNWIDLTGLYFGFDDNNIDHNKIKILNRHNVI